LLNSKLDGRKLRFNTPLIDYSKTVMPLIKYIRWSLCFCWRSWELQLYTWISVKQYVLC